MLKIFYSILFSLVVLVACQGNKSSSANNAGEWQITLSGEVLNPQGDVIVLEKVIDNQFEFVDSLQLAEDNTFETQLSLTEPQYYRIDFFGVQKRVLIVNKDDMQLTVGGDAPNAKFEVEGSMEMNQVAEIDSVMSDFQQEVAGYNNQYKEAQQSNDAGKMQQIRSEVTAIQQKHQDRIKEKLNTMEPSLAVLNLLMSFIQPEQDYEFASKIANKVADKYPNSSHVEQYLEQLEGVKQLAVGEMAPDIMLPNPEGDTVKLSSLKGKVVLIDFWASWCKPCRVENPNVVKVYNKYKNQGFEILGVSLDRSKDAWVKAIEADGLEWLHVSDLKYFNSRAAAKYNVNAIPFTVLIDEEGKIIAKNLRGQALEDKLKEIFR